MLLTFIEDKGALEIHGDLEGWQDLRLYIDELIRNDPPYHYHLMAGCELSEETEREDGREIPYVTIFRW